MGGEIRLQGANNRTVRRNHPDIDQHVAVWCRVDIGGVGYDTRNST